MAPVTDDDLFELYCLVSILDALEQDLGFGRPEEYGLIWRGRRHVALFQHQGVEVSIIFNQSPAKVFGIKTRYKKFTEDHIFYDVGARRPDILLIFKSGCIERRFVVEIKDTTDAKYARDSVYKVFGYLYDFSSVWSEVNQFGLKALLLVPNNVAFIGQTDLEREIVSVSATDREALVKALGMMRSSVIAHSV